MTILALILAVGFAGLGFPNLNPYTGAVGLSRHCTPNKHQTNNHQLVERIV
jgi:hypothetical protein